MRPGAAAAPEPRASIWNEETTRFVADRWRAGDSAAEIVRALAARGVRTNRSAVIGKVHRQKIIRGGRDKPSPPPAKAGFGSGTVSAAAAPPQKRGRPSNLKGRALPAEDWDWREPPPLDLKTPRLAAEGDRFLPAGQQPVGCRFIEGRPSSSREDDPAAGGWRFCQRPQIEGKRYCADHQRLCFGAPPPLGVVEGAVLRRFILSAPGDPEAIAAAVKARFGVPYSVRQVTQIRASAKRRRAA